MSFEGDKLNCSNCGDKTSYYCECESCNAVFDESMQSMQAQVKQKDELLKSCAEEMKVVICGGDFDAIPMAKLIELIEQHTGEE